MTGATTTDTLKLGTLPACSPTPPHHLPLVLASSQMSLPVCLAPVPGEFNVMNFIFLFINFYLLFNLSTVSLLLCSSSPRQLSNQYPLLLLTAPVAGLHLFVLPFAIFGSWGFYIF